MDRAPLQHLVVVGNGLVAAGTAVTLARFLMRYEIRVTWVRTGPEDASSKEVAQPPFIEWLAMVGLSEPEVMANTQGLYSLGVMGEGPVGEFFMPYGRHGISASPASFEHEFYRAYPGGDQRRFNEHFLATQAARRGRFDFPVNDPRSVKSTLRYGMTLDNCALCDRLSRYAQSLGVSSLSSTSIQVDAESADGIHRLRLEDGQTVEGDFYLDATGDKALLIGEALKAPFEPMSALWSSQLTCTFEPSAAWTPYSHLTQESWGWRRQSGLQKKLVAEAWLIPGQVQEVAAEALGRSGAHVVGQSLTWGRRFTPWSHNCLALGRAAGQPGEILVSEWHRACESLLLWLELVPDASGRPGLRQEFNRRDQILFEGWRELHELLSLAGDDHTAPVSEELQWRLQVFQSFGRLWRREQEPMPDETRLALLLGLGWKSASADVALADAPVETLRRKHQHIYDTLVSAAERMPTLEQVIQHHCPAVV